MAHIEFHKHAACSQNYVRVSALASIKIIGQRGVRGEGVKDNERVGWRERERDREV